MLIRLTHKKILQFLQLLQSFQKNVVKMLYRTQKKPTQMSELKRGITEKLNF